MQRPNRKLFLDSELILTELTRFFDGFKFRFGPYNRVGAGRVARRFRLGFGGSDRDDLGGSDNRAVGVPVEEIVGSEQGGEAGHRAEAVGEGRGR